MKDRRERILDATARCIARRGVRALRVHDVAREAGVSPGLLYYHFENRAELLAASLASVSERAARYVAPGDTGDAVADIRAMLLGELQDRAEVVENSSVWGELRASAIFEDGLREPLAAATRDWDGDLSRAIADAQQAGVIAPEVVATAAASMLTSLVEGLSNRWLSGSSTLDAARELLDAAITRVLALDR